ncbi:MAG: hypothetical protein E7580_01795 [Ruminococcaceae bacterium]|nr:hypothetical protein [Oscillospiraceae bacterium]
MITEESRGNKKYGFCVGVICCSFWLKAAGKEVCLYGEEAENGNTIFRLKLSFSSEQADRADMFLRTLADTQTMPRMMAELAEEYFSAAGDEKMNYRVYSSRNSSPSYFLE